MSKKIDIDDDLIRKLADIMDETGLTEIEIGSEGLNVRVARGGQAVSYAAPAPAPSATAAPAAAPSAELSHADPPGGVTAPMAGVAEMAAESGAGPAERVGDKEPAR